MFEQTHLDKACVEKPYDPDNVNNNDFLLFLAKLTLEVSRENKSIVWVLLGSRQHGLYEFAIEFEKYAN